MGYPYPFKMDKKLSVLDVGARYGLHPTWKEASRICEFILVEADPEETKRLEHRYRLCDAVTISNTAITSSKDEYSYLNILGNPAMSGTFKREELTPLFDAHSSRNKQTEIEKIVKVKNMTIDELSRKHGKTFDFIKIDIEGPELSALQSLSTYENVLGVRSEVSFSKGYLETSSSTFPSLQLFFEERGFILLNLDYLGQGDLWSDYVSVGKRYGSLQATDAVWVKNPRKILEAGSISEIIKLSIFCLLNNAPDVSLWLLEESSKKGLKLGNDETNKLLTSFLKSKVVRHFYSLKWIPGQDIATHKYLYEQIFEDSYPEMTLYNESELYNPVESF